MSSFLLALHNDMVVGQLGLVPCEIVVDGRRLQAQWACDLMVDIAFRGKSVARALYERAYQLKEITLGSDPSPAAFISMTRAGFKALAGPVKLILPISIGETIRIKFNKTFGLRHVKNPLLFYLRVTGYKFKKAYQKTSWVEAIPLIGQCRQFLSFPYVVHDSRFLEWRSMPFMNYYKQPSCLISKEFSSYFFYTIAGGGIVVNEWHANSILELAAGLSHILDEAVKNKSYFIKIMGNSLKEVEMLRFLGFLPFRTRTRIIYYPSISGSDPFSAFNYFYYTYWDSDENI